MADRRATPPTSASSSRRMTGLLIAAAFALIGAGVVLFVAMSHRSAGPSTPLPGNVVDIGKPPPPAPGTGGPGDHPQLQESGAARLQFVDKNDPERLSSELADEKLDPVGPGSY